MEKQQTLKAYHKKRAALMLAAVILLIIAAFSSCFVGVANVTVGRVFATLLPGGHFMGAAALNQTELTVLMQLRLPRITMALVSGIGLGISGLVMQAITGNKMASPFTTGLSNAAAFGASLAIIFGFMPFGSNQVGTVMMAFVLAFICAAMVYGIASAKGMGKTTIILIGIALNYFFSALNASMQYVANEQQLSAIVHWTFGSLSEITWEQILVVSVILLLTFPFIVRFAWHYNLLSTGDESAVALGVNVMRLRLLSGIAVTLISSAIVSFTGVIGFVGLVAPHIARLLIGGDYRALIPLTALSGAILLIAADTVGRVVVSPVIIPVGIVVSFIGVPVFIYLIVKEQKERLV
ncbi:FecCD family ABC transporter permease [Eubacterium limosum]|uniref:Iron ABC transporter permease n=1 Tax=Eubacterium limosum TaxID=1736 RepID=A0AAC9W3W7_EUBLI|nr:iron ABC transporter permease [Eubacterium limosum]ARD66701.1 iron ABC transporter permease [Eubacterium limosum]UQZ22680.1 iron ABC transporter permease [Eubacterium limosum]